MVKRQTAKHQIGKLQKVNRQKVNCQTARRQAVGLYIGVESAKKKIFPFTGDKLKIVTHKTAAGKPN